MVAKGYATADKEIIERLQEHYDKGVLPIEPNQKFEELRRQYLENPTGFRKMAAEGLGKTNWTTEGILESDLEGSKIELHPTMPIIAITVPEKTAPPLMKKLGLEGFVGFTFGKYHFKKGSRFRGTTYVILLTDNERFEIIKKHEEWHVLNSSLSRARNDARSVSCETEEGEKVCEAQSLMVEMDLLSELPDYGVWNKNENDIKKRFSHVPPHPLLDRCPVPPTLENAMKTILKRVYVPRSAQYIADQFDDSGVLPDCGIVSRHKARDIVEKAATSYFEDVIDTGVDAFKILNVNLSEDKFKQIITSCGPSKEDVLSGKGYPSPSQELKEWSTHYGNVLANAESAYR